MAQKKQLLYGSMINNACQVAYLSSSTGPTEGDCMRRLTSASAYDTVPVLRPIEKRAAAQELAEADRIKRVTEATAEAEAMEKAGEGIANQRKAIALGIKDSLEIIQETGVGNDEANQLFMFTQWTEMMTEFARTGKTSTVVLPSDFSQSASMFEQMLTAGKVQNESKE